MKPLQKYTRMNARIRLKNEMTQRKIDRINGECAANTEACVFALMERIEDAASKGEWHIEIKDDLILDKENGIDAKTFYDYMAPEVKKAFKKEGISFDHVFYSGTIYVSWHKKSFMDGVGFEELQGLMALVFWGAICLMIAWFGFFLT